MQGSLNIEQMCHLGKVSRAGFYRFLGVETPQEDSLDMRTMIQQIVLEHRRRYGYRRVTRELKKRGIPINHKRVARIMREDNLLAVQQKQFVTTTNSDHKLEIYLNLARRMYLTGVDQLWVADITYIRLHSEFVFLALILDRFSRKVVGWNLDRTLSSRLAIVALDQAIESRHPAPGLVHHSDRGIQYASAEYVAVLRKHEIISSMSRPANPYDNASCESFIKTLKREEIYANEYENLEYLRDNLQDFIERYYNQKRLHSALGYCSPEEFEQQAATANQTSSFAPVLTFRQELSPDFSKGLLGTGLTVPSPNPFPARKDSVNL